MKKLLLSLTAVALLGVVASAQELHGSGTHGLWLCHDPGAPSIQCDDESTPRPSQKCCWKNDPFIVLKGEGGRGAKIGKGTKGGRSSCQERTAVLPIENRPLCRECSTVQDDGHGNKTIKYCENATTDPNAAKRCCWRSRPAKGNNNGVKGVSTPKAPAVSAVKSAKGKVSAKK
ncbi:MAG: hypothetical protein J5594_01760 [Elusimicrobiaceae bacterium]|nr:hypothetical protein [Elusimicrobiaceae bacterium]